MAAQVRTALGRMKIYFLRSISGLLQFPRFAGNLAGIDAFIEKHNEDNRRRAIAKAAGMWKDRDDLPDFSRLGHSLDRHS